MALRQSFRTKHVSKFKHVFGKPVKKEFCYEGVRITKNAWESNFCAVNPKFLAVVLEAQGGGPFLVLPLETTGRIPLTYPKVCGHKGPVLDLQWNPFDDNTLASASEDCTIKIWFIPDGGLIEDLKEYVGQLCGHERKVGIVRWHPCASNIIASAGFDNVVIIWDVEPEAAVLILKGHPDTIFSLSFNWCGSLIATTCKDKKIRVIDPREGKLIVSSFGHRGPKGSQITFVGDSNYLFTSGFSRMNEREIALWDMTNGLEKPLCIEPVDESSGSVMVYYDPDTRMVYLAGKGDGNIRYYEILDEEPYLVLLNEYRSSSPQRGLGFMPKRGLDVTQCEVTRFYKLHNNGNIEPIPMIVPRRDSGTIHFDLFPPTLSNRPAMSAKEWLRGENRSPLLDDLLAGLTGDSGMSRETFDAMRPAKQRTEKRNNVTTQETYTPVKPAQQRVETRDTSKVKTRETYTSVKTAQQRVERSRRDDHISPMQNDVTCSEPHLVNGDKGEPARRGDFMSWDIDTLRIAFADLVEEVHSLKMQLKVRDARIDKLERDHKYYSDKFGF